MTISSISDLLAVSWDHAWCTEGPEFLSMLAASSGGGMLAGPMSMNASAPATIDTWPDEIATADLTQTGNVANEPVYNPASANFNGRPTVECSANGLPSTSAGSKYMSVAFGSTVAQPYEWVIVGRNTLFNAGPIIAFGATSGALATFGTTVVSGGTIPRWDLSLGSSVRVGTPDTNPHLFDAIAGATDDIRIDGTSVGSGNAGANGAERLVISRTAAASTSGYNDFCFIGFKAGALTAGERTDIRTFVSSHYGTP